MTLIGNSNAESLFQNSSTGLLQPFAPLLYFAPLREKAVSRKGAKLRRKAQRIEISFETAFKSEGGDSKIEPGRDDEHGETSEPDAPTGVEENAGMSTVLDGNLGTGVQQDADDE